MRLALIAASLCIGLSLSACTILSTRPDRQIAYAEAAFQAAANAGAETLAPQVFSVARDSIRRARSEYRRKNFKEARKLANRARRLSEEAEMRALAVERLGDLSAPTPEASNPPSGG